MQFGAAVWPFQWYPPYDDAIRRVARLGFRHVELIAWDRDALQTYYTPDRIAALRRLIADEGLTLSEFVTTPTGIASADRGRRAAAVDHFHLCPGYLAHAFVKTRVCRHRMTLYEVG